MLKQNMYGISFLIIMPLIVYTQESGIHYINNDLQADFSGILSEETYYGKNNSLLNSSNDSDRIYYNKMTADFSLDVAYGAKSYETPITESRFNIRTKGVWGNSSSIVSTEDATVKEVDVVGGIHKHTIPRHIFWAREIWVRMCLANLLGLSFSRSHKIQIGAFPFSVGRGIALGNAFAVSPNNLGFFGSGVVDQYAFGTLLSGDFSSSLSYDLYGAILENKSDSIAQTAEQIRGQEFGQANNPQRGFGSINFVVAAQTQYTPFKETKFFLSLQPYGLYNNAPEQKVEFIADSKSTMGTVGCAGEMRYKSFELGFDFALNIGHQTVKGWDRNRLEKQNRNGVVTVVYSDIVDVDPALVTPQDINKVVYDGTNTEQIDAIKTVAQSALQNGQSVSNTSLYNSVSRFRKAYKNKYKGWMAVTDMSWLLHDNATLSATVGVASGDENPNANLSDPHNAKQDKDYKGFVGLQELYAGKRVKSTFVLGPSRKLQRPSSHHNTGDRFAQVTQAFNNIIYSGVGVIYKPRNSKKNFSFNPNILMHWQHSATKKFDLETGLSSAEFARKFLGLEFNLSVAASPMKDVQLTCVATAFKPGHHYYDINGTPLDSAQRAALDRADSSISKNTLPLIGYNTAYSFNMGLAYSF